MSSFPLHPSRTHSSSCQASSASGVSALVGSRLSQLLGQAVVQRAQLGLCPSVPRVDERLPHFLLGFWSWGELGNVGQRDGHRSLGQVEIGAVGRELGGRQRDD